MLQRMKWTRYIFCRAFNSDKMLTLYKVKKKLKSLLREGAKAPEQFAWPKNMPEPSVVMHSVIDPEYY